MPGRKGARALREEGLQRTDNDMETTSWPQVSMINQKNYYTDYLKRDDQILVLRMQNEESRNKMARAHRDRDRALAHGGQNDDGQNEMDIDVDENMANEDGTDAESYGKKIIVIHPGSQNLRIGLASDALPKTVPMVIARKSDKNEAEDPDDEPRPKRRKTEDGTPIEVDKTFGDGFASQFATMASDLTLRLRRKGHRVVPQSRPQAIAFNRKNPARIISEHNDTNRVDWTEIPSNPQEAPEYIAGHEALRIPDYSNPRYKLYWPIQYGFFNEDDYEDKNQILRDFTVIIEEAIKTQLGLAHKKEWTQYDCVFVVPDLYERSYVTTVLDLLLREFAFNRVCFIQESLSASFGAGYSTCVIVDIGAQKTSICCVDEGMCIENSRVNLRMGGSDVTDAFVKSLILDGFPYADINLRRRHDYILAEELKHKICTLSFAELEITRGEFHLRVHGEETRFFTYRTYDSIRMAPMGYFKPELFDNSNKLNGRRKLIPRTYDLYDGSPNDPSSAAQNEILDSRPEALAQKTEVASVAAAAAAAAAANNAETGSPAPSKAQPAHSPTPARDVNAKAGANGTEDKPSTADSPNNNDGETPQAAASGGTPLPGAKNDEDEAEAKAEKDKQHPIQEAIKTAAFRDTLLPISALDAAIVLSIENGARGDERKMRDYFGGIIPVGGGTQVKGFHGFLEEELQAQQAKFKKDVIVGLPPREIDPVVLVWKGASVFGKLTQTNDTWIGSAEYDRLGSRLLAYKCLWSW